MVNNNFKDVEKYFAENGYGQENVFQSGNKYENSVRLRLDAELAQEQKFNQKQEMHILMIIAESELVDLGINGDSVGHHDDAYLNNIDGANKRGKSLAGIEVTSAMVFKEPKEKKKTDEFTIYLTVKFFFKDNEKVA